MLTFALIGAISPGPVNIIASIAAANFGFRQALPHVLGASLCYCLVVFIMGLALNLTLDVLPTLTHLLQYLGAAFLLYMALKIALAPLHLPGQQSLAKPPSFWQGVLAQGLNPKAWLVAMSGVSLFVAPQQQAEFYLLVFCLISLMVCLVGVGTWAAVGSLIAKYLGSARRLRVFNCSMAALLAGSVLSLFI